MVVVSENTGSTPLIGSKVIARPTDFFEVKRGLGSKVRRQIRCKLRPVRGRPDIRWSENAPLAGDRVR